MLVYSLGIQAPNLLATWALSIPVKVQGWSYTLGTSMLPQGAPT